MRIERGGSGSLAATLRDVRVTAGALTAAVKVGDQEWQPVLHTAIHEWFKTRQPGMPGPERSER